MADLDDFDLDGTKPAPPGPEGSGWGLRAGRAPGNTPPPPLLSRPRSPLSGAGPRRGGGFTARRSYAGGDASPWGGAATAPAEAARVFSRLEPLFETAWRELGHPEPFRSGVAR